LVKTGGGLVYTTCTFSSEENEGVIASLLAHHPEFELDLIQPVTGYQPARPDWIGLTKEHRINRAIRIWPHNSKGEGHFIALLTKHESVEIPQEAGAKKTALLPKREIKTMKHLSKSILDGYCNNNLFYTFENERVMLDGSFVYQLPEITPNLVGLKVVRFGWWLGSIKNDRFSPSHSLAMGINCNQAKQILPLRVGDQLLSSYFAGESFPNSGENGWVLLSVDGFPVGWGKRVQNMIKNFYPHGLRCIA
jgi:NOL1/NOP2/fmu family ribosome biogenesis protein